MARIVAKREKDQRTEYDQLNNIADIHDGTFSPFSVNKRWDYSYVLTLFGQGWDQHRFRFTAKGDLIPDWGQECASSQ